MLGSQIATRWITSAQIGRYDLVNGSSQPTKRLCWLWGRCTRGGGCDSLL